MLRRDIRTLGDWHELVDTIAGYVAIRNPSREFRAQLADHVAPIYATLRTTYSVQAAQDLRDLPRTLLLGDDAKEHLAKLTRWLAESSHYFAEQFPEPSTPPRDEPTSPDPSAGEAA